MCIRDRVAVNPQPFTEDGFIHLLRGHPQRRPHRDDTVTLDDNIRRLPLRPGEELIFDIANLTKRHLGTPSPNRTGQLVVAILGQLHDLDGHALPILFEFLDTRLGDLGFD